MTRTSSLLDLNATTLWVCSDVHGHWEDYHRVRSAFERQAGSEDALVYLGDLIHARTHAYTDHSLRILHDLRQRPDPRIISLLGNHELMHLYHWQVKYSQGMDYVGTFEQAVAAERESVMRWLCSWPVAVRWRNGLLHHTGASARVLRTDPTPTYPFVLTWNHAQLLERICEQGGFNLQASWRQFNPAVGQFFATTRTGRFVWDSWFTKNEQLYGLPTYANLVTEMLDVYSMDHARLQWVVTGHIPAPAGHALVGTQQLRLCSSTGSEPGQGHILRLRSDQSYHAAADLTHALVNLRDLA